MSNAVPSGWSVHELGDLAHKIEGGGTPSRTEASFWNGDIPWATVKDLRAVSLRSTEEHITELGLKNSSSKLIPANTIIIATRMAVGKAVFFDRDVAINQDLKAFHPKNGINWRFLLQWYLAKSEKIENLATGSTVKGIRLDELKLLPVDLPPLPEQQKIAAILSSVDDVIEKTRAQIDKLKDLKTGMMQELLTKGIGSGGVPHMEYKDSPVGRIPTEWNIKTLGEVFALTSGSTPSRGQASYFSTSANAHPWVKTMDLNGSTVSVTDEKITDKALKDSACKLLPSGTALIAMYGGWNQIGRSGVLGISAATNQAICALVSKGLVDGYYANYWLTAMRPIWKSIAASSRKDPNITKQDVSNFLIAVPPLAEQQRIVEKLNTFTDLIENKQVQLANYRDLKKALMQDLLTGKVRVNVDQKESAVA